MRNRIYSFSISLSLPFSRLNLFRKYKNILVSISSQFFAYVTYCKIMRKYRDLSSTVRHCYLFLAVFGRRFWFLSGTLTGILPFCLTSDLIVSMEVFRPSISIWFVGFSSGSLNSGRYRWFRSIDIVDEELSSSSLRCDRFDVEINLLFADFILRRRASVPSKLSPVNSDHSLF